MSKNVNYVLIALSILLSCLIYSCSHNEEPEIYYCGLTSQYQVIIKKLK